ncbi:MAG TPA: transporter [Pyrinomonadaceae bacterium]|nr:transporter [Pyrinomonadaceae bacterium]
MKRFTQILSRPIVRIGVCLAVVLHCGFAPERAHAQQKSLEERQPLELVFADSIVPQDRHETMLTTGVWYFRHHSAYQALLTQKVEWGISDQLQVATFIQLVNSSNALGSTRTGVGDIEVGARYTWSNAGSPFTHVALALEAGFPTGNSGKGLSEGAYSVSTSVLLSRELGQGKYQLFSTTGTEIIIKHRRLDSSDDPPRNSVFSNGGLSVRIGPGWAVGEMSVSSNRWSGGSETQLAFTPSYVWRLGKRAELLFGVPIGLTSSTDRVGGVVKFTFELGGKPD